MKRITNLSFRSVTNAVRAALILVAVIISAEKAAAQATAFAASCAAYGPANNLLVGGCSNPSLAVSGASSGLAPCSGTVFSEGWMTINNGASQPLIITGYTASANSQLQLQLFSACGGIQIACTDSITTLGFQTEVMRTATMAAGTYFLRVINAGNAAMTAAVCVESDNVCNSAQPLTSNGGCSLTSAANERVIGNNHLSAVSAPSGGTCAAVTGPFQRERWYSYVTPPFPANQVLSVEAGTIAAVGNLVVQLFENTGGCSLNQLDCANATDNYSAQTEVATYSSAVANTTYYIRVLYYYTSSVNITLSKLCINTSCDGATPVPIGSCLNGNITLTDAGMEITSPLICSGTFQREGWFSFTTPAAGNYTVAATSTSGSTNLQIQVLSGVCGSALTQLGCSELITSTSSQTEEVSVAIPAAGTYFARIINSNNVNSNMDINEICVNPTPTNDNCDSATTIPTPLPGAACVLNNGTLAGGTPGSAGDLAATSCTPINAPNEDVWYTFTTSSLPNQLYTITVAGLINPAFQVFIGSPCSGAGILVAGAGGCITTAGTATYTYTANGAELVTSTQYWVRVFENTTTIANTAAFTFSISSPPLNDICSGAFLLTAADTCVPFVPVVPQSSTVMNATNSSVIANASGGCNLTSPIDDVWFYFVAPATGATQSITVSGLGLAPVLEVFDAGINGNCNSFTATNSIVCNASSVANATVSVSFAIINNHTYYLRIYDYNGGGTPFTLSSGVFTICVTNPPVTTEIQETVNLEVLVYPNPNNGMIIIENNSTETSPLLFVLFDITGRQVIHQELKTNTVKSIIDATELKPGAYFYEIKESGKRNTNGKLIIVK